MRFKDREPVLIQNGAYRRRTFFCFLPYRAFGYTYWLETITVEEHYHIERCDGPQGPGIWKPAAILSEEGSVLVQ